MSTKLLITVFLLATASFAIAAPQDHHCKLPGGNFDAKTTEKQCTDAKGVWTKDVSFTGTFETGVARANAGTAYELVIDTKTSYEVELHGDKDLIAVGDKLNSKRVTITGFVETPKAVEDGRERHVLVATTLVAAK